MTNVEDICEVLQSALTGDDCKVVEIGPSTQFLKLEIRRFEVSPPRYSIKVRHVVRELGYVSLSGTSWNHPEVILVRYALGQHMSETSFPDSAELVHAATTEFYFSDEGRPLPHASEESEVQIRNGESPANYRDGMRVSYDLEQLPSKLSLATVIELLRSAVK